MGVVFRRYWPVLVATAVLLPHAALFDFVNDDAYISFRYARNLAEHGQLVFNLGERVEGFTNFLWTVILAGAMKLGVNPVVSSRFLGIAFAVATLAVVVRLSLRLDEERPSPWHLVAPLALAATGAFACWSTGGLETQLFTFLVILAFERLLAELESERGAWSAVLFALAGMTRPEGIMLFGLAGLFRVVHGALRRRSVKPAAQDLIWASLFVAVFAPYFVWRWRYYGWPFPNTFYVKASGGPGTWMRGAYYLRRFVEDHGLVFLIPLVLLGRPARTDEGRRRLYVLTGLVWTAFAVYVVKVGGDFMGLYRFILPVLPLGAIVLQESVRRLFTRLVPIAGWPAVALAGVAVAGAFVSGSAKVSHTAATHVGADNGIDTPAYLKKYADERVAIGKWFGQHVRPDDLMTVGGAGVIPYYAGVRAFDVFGLVDETIAHDPTMTRDDRPGHQKWGDDRYMLSRNPTLITHYYCLGGPCGQEQIQFAGYEWVRAPIPGVYYSFMKRADRSLGPLPARSP